MGNPKRFQLLVYDFDGVLTDNRVWVNQDGVEWVACNRSDGWWMKEIRKLGLAQLILSTEQNPVVTARGKKVGIEVLQGVKDKKQALIDLCRSRRIDLESVIYVGNEMNDKGCFEVVGFTFAPEDSHPEILRQAKQVIPAKGGAGIVRHIFDWLVLPN